MSVRVSPSRWPSKTRAISSFRYRLGGPDGVEMTAVLDDHVWIEPNSFDAMIEGITMMCRFFTIKGSIRRS
jgi:hypothetical protein